jgi:DNA-binding transcriptional MocR family regulator
MGMSDANIAWHFKLMSMQSIGPNKVNQLRHMRFLPDVEAVRVHMLKHAELLRPKFEAVLKELDEQIEATGTGTYCRPRGGYFISLDVWNGCAKRVLDLLAAIGVQMTPAGSTYPYKKDPYDRNIRIAPTFITIEELVPAMRLLCLCVRIAACEKRLAQ